MARMFAPYHATFVLTKYREREPSTTAEWDELSGALFRPKSMMRSSCGRSCTIVRSLEARGDVVARADLARVSPLAHAHVIPSGTYRFPSKNEGSAS